jgi:hypothetical protein
MSGCRFQTFHQNRLFSFRSPVSPFLHPVSYSTRFSNVFTRGRFHPSLFRLPPFAYYSMYGCRFQTFSPKSAVFRSGRPSAHFWPPESYSTRFSTVFTRGRFHPSIFRLLPFAYDSMSGCHFQTFSPKSVVFVSVALQPVFGLPCTRFSTVLACGRFYPSMIHLHPYPVQVPNTWVLGDLCCFALCGFSYFHYGCLLATSLPVAASSNLKM